MNSGISNTRATCRPRGHFVQPAMLFGNFEIINIYIILFIHRCLKVLGPACQQVHFKRAMSNPNGLLSKKICHCFNQSRTMSGMLEWAAH